MVLINTRPTCKDGASSDTLLLVVEDVYHITQMTLEDTIDLLLVFFHSLEKTFSKRLNLLCGDFKLQANIKKHDKPSKMSIALFMCELSGSV